MKKNLPNYKVQYYSDYFVDYKGSKRMFTLAAVSVPETEDDNGMKRLHLGMSIQHSDDKADPELGKKIAYGKAIKYWDHVLLASSPGMINTAMVDALLKQEAEYFKKNPSSYITGYEHLKKQWLKGVPEVKCNSKKRHSTERFRNNVTVTNKPVYTDYTITDGTF